MLKLVFVILHYQNMDDTINCIESIKKLEMDSEIEIKIIIIDNKSPNNSGIELKNKYIDDSTIEILLMDKNYGFSIANNEGYKLALKYNPNIVLVINNDIIFEDKGFIIKLKKLYNSKQKYDIICPDIININDNHQNPLRDKEMTLKKAYKNMIYESIFALTMNIPILRYFVVEANNKREKKWFENYYKAKRNINITEFVPFGAFIIYMNNWLKNEDRAFVSDTFMYEEEDMLSLYIKKKKYKILYVDELKVKHLEGQSTKKSNKNQYQHLKFKSKNKSKALKKYIKFYKKFNNER